MNMVDKVFEEVPCQSSRRQVLDFVGFLKSRHCLNMRQPANDATSMVNEEDDWGEFEKLAGTWSGKSSAKSAMSEKFFADANVAVYEQKRRQALVVMRRHPVISTQVVN